VFYINPINAPVGVAGLDYVEWTYPASRVAVRVPIATLGMHPRRDTLTPQDLAHIRYGVTNIYREQLWAQPAIGALEAQHAAVHGYDDGVDDFSRAIGIPAAKTSAWREAVSTALIGDWTQLVTAGRDQLIVPQHIKREAERAHRQQQPLWEHKVNGRRVSLLEAPIGDGLTLRDLISEQEGSDAAETDRGADGPRLEAVLGTLEPEERDVALAWAHPGIRTWADAARHARAADPEVFGERVRRKVRRIAARRAEQAASATRTRAAAAGRLG